MRTTWRSGEPFIWLTGGALAVSLLLVAGLILLVLVNGLGYFWPANLVRLDLKDGRTVLGRVTEREAIPDPDAAPGTPVRHRIQVKQGNRDLYGADFLWIDEDAILHRSLPSDAVAIERREWGDLYGTLHEMRVGDTVVARGPEEVWRDLQKELPGALRLVRRIRALERDTIGDVNYAQDQIRLELRGLELRGVTAGPRVETLVARRAALQGRYDALVAELGRLRQQQDRAVVVEAAGGQTDTVPLAKIVRAIRPNRMGVPAKLVFYARKVWEFVSADPRESNTEGGVFPAIFGTVMMVVLMSLLVTPLGVLAAVYLREYARQGTLVSTVRIAVNNLAGVPSIVFGVFGVGFFIYLVGGGIDRLFFPEALPTPTFGTGGILWASLTLALLTVPVVIVATEEGLAAVPRGMREASMALGATKFETTWRVVLPAVLPSVLTGLILAMARAAGEVAPLMITGVVKLAPSLPIDGHWPFVHLERKFMHLGFYIYDVGFQSPNVDAARPMVYTTTLLLLLIVLLLNVAAIALRNRLRKKYFVSAL
ncbi:MAG TPA: phosphate ABC transporter permease PstA [Candidatus Polarisedimenticolia bacterium]|nr:phosphate ABC transporter permease PstA [Candidatus Polarisedimenticolia bacterium]